MRKYRLNIPIAFNHRFVFGCDLHMYRRNSLLCIDGEVIFSQEGTTQGDPLVMIIYSIVTLPLVHHLAESTSARQVWFAYDAMAGGQLQCVKDWWDELETGPNFGYYANATKSLLL